MDFSQYFGKVSHDMRNMRESTENTCYQLGIVIKGSEPTEAGSGRRSGPVLGLTFIKSLDEVKENHGSQ